MKPTWLTKHGMSRTPFYGVWRDMKRRCNNPKDRQFFRYGGRGIKCLWNSFEEFKDDMYESYLIHRKEYPEYRNTSIDRIDVNGNYCKENCRWATHKVQQNNKTITPKITYKGITKNRKEWSKIFDIPDHDLYNRIKLKWPLYKIFNKSVRPHHRKNGKIV